MNIRLTARLKKATLLAIISISYIFVLRTIRTFSSLIFTNLLIIKVTGIISLLASLTIVFFFIYFYKDYLQKEQIKLKMATILVILVSLIGLAIQISIVFNITILLYFLMIYLHIDVIVSLFSALFILIFFISFYSQISRKELTKLRKATSLAVIGAGVFTAFQIFSLFNYLYYLRFGYPISLVSNKLIIFLIGIPIISFWFLAELIFFIFFYKINNHEANL